ncbi:hypothetical protein JYT59_00420 [Sphingobacteriaceae bacterium AH-315-L07]|nr:hypothetical protein [Sphingobacteriaceae bacterium AH-315-L07]
MKHIKNIAEYLKTKFKEYDIDFLLLSFIISELKYVYKLQSYKWDDIQDDPESFDGASDILEAIKKYEIHPINIESVTIRASHSKYIITPQKIETYLKESKVIPRAEKFQNHKFTGTHILKLMFKYFTQIKPALELYSYTEHKHETKKKGEKTLRDFISKIRQYSAYTIYTFINAQKHNFNNDVDKFRLIGELLLYGGLIDDFNTLQKKSKNPSTFYRNKPDYYLQKHSRVLVKTYQEKLRLDPEYTFL